VFGYKIYEEVKQLDQGELSKTFVRVYDDERGDEFRQRLKRETENQRAAELEDVPTQRKQNPGDV